ncbi:MAG: hypothetical protein LLF96_09735 [Eubacteriales bacterium]|nr:hypothetical protein [Eubacteriales bacterium]
MREIMLRVECPKIKINGQVFDLLLSDLDIYTRAQALFARCEHIADAPRATAEILSAAGEATTLLEAALGGGAIAAISGSRPVSLTLALEWLGMLAREAAEHYADATQNDEDDPDVV